MIKYVFNPFTGTFDAIDEATSTVDAAGRTESAAGEFTVGAGLNPGQLVYSDGSLTADLADNGDLSTSPAIGIIRVKPTATTATVTFSGRLAIFAGLTVGADYFMGTSGSTITAGSLPAAAGSVIQKIGVAVSATTLLLNIQLPVVL